jgi:hypothetical protein
MHTHGRAPANACSRADCHEARSVTRGGPAVLSDIDIPGPAAVVAGTCSRSNTGMELLELHVRPDERSGAWVVARDRVSGALSSHQSANEAEHAARRLAAARGAERIFLHDRYRRVRRITTLR